jgi:hypothetical protein
MFHIILEVCKLTNNETIVEITMLELGIILIQVYDFSQILLF